MNYDTADRPKGSNTRILLVLIPFIRPYAPTLCAAVAALLVAAGAMLALPVAVRLMIDHAFSVSRGESMDVYFLFLFAVTAVFSVFVGLRVYLVSWLGERVVADLRTAVYGQVLKMTPTFFEVTRTGEVLSRLTTDTTLVQSIAGVGLSITLRSLVSLIGGAVMLTLTSPQLTLLIFVLIPGVVVPIVVFGRRVRRLSRASQDQIADSSGIAGETLAAIETVQAFTLERLQQTRFASSVHDSFVIAIERTRARAWLSAGAVLAVCGSIVLVLWVGAHAVIDGSMTAGQLGQFLLYAIFMAGALASLSEMWGELQRGAGAMERIVELLDLSPDIQAPADPTPLPDPITGEIVFDAVTFHYPSRPEQAALNDFSLRVRPGETVAVVGPSGAGKSTLFQLLMRFYDPSRGRILINGIRLCEADPERIREKIGIVPQDTVVFAASALDNIRYGRPDASDEEVREASRAAAADEFIMRLPDAYATFLGERGTRLSGGQRQRIAIARAILKNSPILLLDEATSSLDAESERSVQAALYRLMLGRTTIVIAHRLATVMRADRLIVMDHGRVVETGRHEDLIKQHGLYARLAAFQFDTPPADVLDHGAAPASSAAGRGNIRVGPPLC